MKNTLLTTTAIALTSFAGTASAVEVASGAVNLSISGYFDVLTAYSTVGGSSTVGSDFDGFDVHTTSEIHFKPSITLDNGITIGADVELEGDTSGDQIDESSIFASGSFGLIEIGSKDSAAKRLGITAPDTSMVYANSSSLFAFLPYGFAATTSSYADLASDAERFTYLTPNFNGFQAGISYARDAAGDAAGSVNNTVTVTDFIDLGASYNGTVGGADLGVSAGWSTADAVGAGVDPETTRFGLSVASNGFKFGGSYLDFKTGAEAYDIGVSYETGPMVYSATYFNGEAALAAAEYTHLVLAARYHVGDNFDVTASISDVSTDAAGVENFDGQVFALGASFWF